MLTRSSGSGSALPVRDEKEMRRTRGSMLGNIVATMNRMTRIRVMLIRRECFFHEREGRVIPFRGLNVCCRGFTIWLVIKMSPVTGRNGLETVKVKRSRLWAGLGYLDNCLL
jgi:hypothetical protein